jgi:hypothetical protein
MSAFRAQPAGGIHGAKSDPHRDGLIEVGQLEAVVIPLSVRILVGGIEFAVDKGRRLGNANAFGEYGTEINTAPRLRSA